MRIVLDTNVLVSALIRKGKPRKLLLEIIEERQLILSREILEEFVRTCSHPKILRYVDRNDVARFLKDVASTAEIVKIRSKSKAVKEDPDDDMILRTCSDGRARYLVSGDNHLLKLEKFRRILIVTVDEMLSILQE